MSRQLSKLELLESCLKKFHSRRRKPRAQNIVAAVALVVRNKDDSLDLLFIKRAERTDDPWSGQIAFPGGCQQAEDKSTLDTLLRETKEEVGLDLSCQGKIIGSLDDEKSSVNEVIITPYVAWIPNTIEVRLNEEVAEYFWIPIDGLRKVYQFPIATQRGILNIEAYIFGKHVIWGLTARILDGLFKCVINFHF